MSKHIRRKGGKRGAHPSYGVMMTSKPKHQGPWKPGKKPGSKFTFRGARRTERSWIPPRC